MSEETKMGRPTNDDLNKKVLTRLRSYWDLGKQYYTKDYRRMKVLDQVDRGYLWQATGITFPAYQILPDTNYVSYVKTNLVASIYSVIKAAEIMPTSEDDKELCTNLNIAMDCLWDTQKVGFYQFQAGERAALFNLGITQVGWDEHIILGAENNIMKGNVRLRNIDPMKFMRDPFASTFDDAGWCCTWDNYHRSVFESTDIYKDAFKVYRQQHKEGNSTPSPNDISPDGVSKNNAKDYYTLICWWIRRGDKIHEYHTINNEAILHSNEDLIPNKFPFALLHCNLPSGALVGTSEPAKIMANNIAYNLLDSMALTAEYKNQRPPKFISDQSKLNVAAFAKHGDEADRTFVVSGDASKAVHYHQFPQVSNFLSTLKTALSYDIQTVTGVNSRYTGRETGSITTTGGAEEMFARVSLVDAPKILLYENYCKTLTELILLNMIEFCPERKFIRKKPNSTKQYDVISVPFPELDANTIFNYRISVSSELPKNKQNIAAAATELLKAQAQYRQDGSQVNWITEEEWLMFQDLPFKEYMLERMGVQRQEDALAEVAQVLYGYSDLIDQGATSDQAMQAMAEVLKQTRQGGYADAATSINPNNMNINAGAPTLPMK